MTILFKYLHILPLGGRGGVTRFFMLIHDIPFEEELVDMSQHWPQEKQRLVKSGENPCGSLPILYLDGKAHPQHIATLRYLSRLQGLTSTGNNDGAYQEYVQDLVADEYQTFRDQWANTTFMGTDEEKAVYKKGPVFDQLKKFDCLYEKFKTHDKFLSVSTKNGKPLWGDAAIFGLIRDHILTDYITKEDLASYTHLMGMYEAFESIPAVQNWQKSLKE